MSEIFDKITSAAITVSNKPDPFTKAEIEDLDHQERKIILEGLQNDLEARKTFANRVFWLIAIWLIVVALIILLQGWKLWGFSVSDKVLLALLTGTTVNVLGLFLVVANYFFPKNGSLVKGKH